MVCASYMNPSSGIDAGRLLRKALAAKAMSLKTAAIWMSGPNYEATFNRALSGMAPLDVHAIVNLPMPIVFKFARLLIAAKLKQWEAEVLSERRSA